MRNLTFAMGYWAPAVIMFLAQCAFWYWVGTRIFT
jgi:hypothetical protein